MRRVRNILGWVLAVGAVLSMSWYNPGGVRNSRKAAALEMPVCPKGCPYSPNQGSMLDASYPYAEMVSPPTCPYHKR